MLRGGQRRTLHAGTVGDRASHVAGCPTCRDLLAQHRATLGASVPDDEEPVDEGSALGASPDEPEHRPNLWRRLVNSILGFFRRMRDGFYEMLAEAGNAEDFFDDERSRERRRRRRAEIAQLVEHATENRGVASSTLALGTNNPGVAQHPERKWLSW